MANAEQTQDDELEGELEKGSPLVERIGLFLGPLLAGAAWLAGPSVGIEGDKLPVLALLVLMATWWVTLAVEPAITGLLPFVALSALGLGKPAEIVGPYANDVIFLFGGGALVAYVLWAFELSGGDGSLAVELSAVPFALALLRYLLLSAHGRTEAPEEAILSDRVLAAAGVAWAALFAVGIGW